MGNHVKKALATMVENILYRECQKEGKKGCLIPKPEESRIKIVKATSTECRDADITVGRARGDKSEALIIDGIYEAECTEPGHCKFYKSKGEMSACVFKPNIVAKASKMIREYKNLKNHEKDMLKMADEAFKKSFDEPGLEEMAKGNVGSEEANFIELDDESF